MSQQTPLALLAPKLAAALAVTFALSACPAGAPRSPANEPADGAGDGPVDGDGEGEGDGVEGEGEGDGNGVAGEGEGEGDGASEGEGEGEDPSAGEGEGEGETAAVPRVFVIVMENKPEDRIYGSVHAPYINDVLMTEYASASAYADVIPDLPSEPHYVFMEAGTNELEDHTFATNEDPSASNSTADTRHLASQLTASGQTWRSYQEDISADTTGACPIHESGFYAPKHNPFVFFQDVAGNPPSESNAVCIDHHRRYERADFAADLSAGDVASYTFISPNQCNDMHGADGCPNGCTGGDATACISEGDRWLEQNVPPIVDFINANGGVLFIMWDESEGSNPNQPFVVVGPDVKPGHVSTVPFTHASYVKTVQTMLGLDVDARVSEANDFADFFELNRLP